MRAGWMGGSGTQEEVNPTWMFLTPRTSSGRQQGHPEFTPQTPARCEERGGVNNYASWVFPAAFAVLQRVGAHRTQTHTCAHTHTPVLAEAEVYHQGPACVTRRLRSPTLRRELAGGPTARDPGGGSRQKLQA